MRAIPDCAVQFIKDHEKLRLDAYLDSAGIVTVGWGHVATGMKVGQTIPQSLAELYLKGDLETAAKRVCAYVSEPVLLDLTDNQYAALLSFEFNTGAPLGSTIWKVLNARDHDHVPTELMRWVYASDPKTKAKVKVQGLVNRRAAEVQLWSTGEPGSVPDEPSSAVTRVTDTPPLPAKPAPVITAAVSAVAAVPVAVQQIQTAIAPYAGQAPFVAKMVPILATVAAGAAVVLLILHWLQTRQAKA